MSTTTLLTKARPALSDLETNEGNAALAPFRRAVADGDAQAWACVWRRYQLLVLAWCRRAGAAEDDVEERAGEAWARFWRGYTPERLAAARGLADPLAYLKACARSAVLDAARPRARPTCSLEAVAAVPDREPTPEARYLAAERRKAFARTLDALLRDERERTLVALTYEAGLRSAEVQALRPDLFPHVGDVYRVTRNLLDRLRRSPALRAWLATA